MIKVIKQTSDNYQKEKKKEKAQKKISELRRASEEQEAADKAHSLGIPYLDTNLFPISTESIKIIPEDDARKYGLAIIRKTGTKINVAVTKPEEKDFQNYIEKLSEERGWKFRMFLVSQRNMEQLWKKYKKIASKNIIDQYEINLEEEDVEKFEKELKDLITLKQRIRELPTTQVLNILMAGAYKLGASDVHIEPEEDGIRIRYRIDGVLHDVVDLPLSIYKPVLSRIKMMGGMKINVRDIAQDGTFEINLEDKAIDVRVSTVPGNYGEIIVMRILDPSSILLSLEELGMRGRAYEVVKKEIGRPEGMILTTGPTGSGKTTTLYAIINELNNPERKIITIEDPIEYEVQGISQTQVEKSRGYDFSGGLRAIVRQDPDVILVGEIRDEDTADIAVNAALTGHLMLSTLHTNNSVATIPRLIEMSVKPNLISPSTNAIIAQRLVRRLCPHCKEEYVPAEESIDSIKKIISIISPKANLEIPKKIEKLYRPKGCSKCNNIGYKGRTGIFEVLTINKEIEQLILDMASKSELMVAALESGMITMLQDGLLKSIEGITSVEEVQRVTGEGSFLEEVYDQLMNQIFSRKVLIKKEIWDRSKESSKNLKDLEKVILDSKTPEILKVILSTALMLRASDVNLEPEEDSAKIRFRIDGTLQTVANIPLNEYPNLLGEIKILGGIKSETRQGAQDSRFSIKLDEKIEEDFDSSIDARISIILGGYGETAVIRLLNQSATALNLEELGIRKENLEKIREQMKKPNGMILNTGPTGSGKTTTLYSILNELNRPEVKIITVEDPIEYQLPGILQTPVNEEDGYTFASALRSILRQNPNIIMIGEIRDQETASISIQASLTGHLIISTLHTNNASGSVQRLTDMGTSTKNIVSAANAFMAQRLVRKLCPHCKEKVKPTEEEKKRLASVLESISPKSGITASKITNIFKPKGCDKCNNIGYRGRTVISEVLPITAPIEEVILANQTASQIEEKAKEEGMITMAQDGALKVLEGETSLEEIERVTEA